jgi:hypothetical protein
MCSCVSSAEMGMKTSTAREWKLCALPLKWRVLHLFLTYCAFKRVALLPRAYSDSNVGPNIICFNFIWFSQSLWRKAKVFPQIRQRLLQSTSFAILHILIIHSPCLFAYLSDWSGTESTITAAIYWPILPALDYRWWWLWSSWRNEWVPRETRVLGKNLPQWRSVNHSSHMNWPGLEPGPP